MVAWAVASVLGMLATQARPGIEGQPLLKPDGVWQSGAQMMKFEYVQVVRPPRPVPRLEADSLVQVVPDPPTGSPCQPQPQRFPRALESPRSPDPGIQAAPSDPNTRFLIRRVVPESCAAQPVTPPPRR